MERKRLLITGCGRSGTLYAARVWQFLGLDIRHERPVPPDGIIGADGMASWFMAVDDPQPPSGPSARDYQFDVVIHQVRQPLKVIASMAQFILRQGKRAPGFIERHVPETQLNPDEQNCLNPQEQLLLKAARYWYRWNLLAEAKADRTIQVERLDQELPDLCDLVGIPYRPGVVDRLSKDINARRYHVPDDVWVIDWKQIRRLDMKIYENAKNLAVKYGYEEWEG
jgi:hypothetical protein